MRVLVFGFLLLFPGNLEDIFGVCVCWCELPASYNRIGLDSVTTTRTREFECMRYNLQHLTTEHMVFGEIKIQVEEFRVGRIAAMVVADRVSLNKNVSRKRVAPAFMTWIRKLLIMRTHKNCLLVLFLCLRVALVILFLCDIRIC